ncbi:DGQHR domain-containing protein [Fulvivirga sp. M361]|uniref:DGQHR domain-containing protein n=1 Tax=Fulvivirga sp. M361 TaxID=2594266 RepID=UPI00117AB013|nr:DGQHR domain-containing protein [Fulvivirga sp. M361]TRX49638.1 DGQHR domain-containing protein [Fulvivirga sp. M361]
MIFNINDRKYVGLICQKLKQPIGLLYMTCLSWKTLYHVSFADTRVLTGVDDDGNEIYRGIQRILSSTRQKEIRKYVTEFEYATFPTSIIINLPHEKIDLVDINVSLKAVDFKKERDIHFPDAVDFFLQNDNEPSNQTLLIFPYEKSIAQIIDGQHRLSGFNVNDEIEFDLPVTIFVDQTVENQAEIFSTINGKQTRVTSSLVYELFGITDRRSPYRSAHEITKILNESEESPIKQWIKRLGKSTDHYEGFVTQSTINKNIFQLISGNAKQADEDMMVLSRKDELTMDTPYSKKTPPLRKYFIQEEEEVIAKVIINFYRAVKHIFTEQWNSEESIFKRTVGFNAMFKVMIDLIEIGVIENDLSEENFIEKLEKIGDVNFNVQLSSKGVNELYSQFKNQITKSGAVN